MESRAFKPTDHTENSYSEAEVMTGQPYQFTRQIPPVQGSKPYTCSCLEHYLAFLTEIQLCDIYYDGKLNTVDVQFKTTERLNSEAPRLLETLKCSEGQFNQITKKRTYFINHSLWYLAVQILLVCADLKNDL